MEEEWATQLSPVDWSTKERSAFRRQFLALPDQDEPGVDAVRKALGVQIEDCGGHWVLPAPGKTFEEFGVLPRYAMDSLAEHNITSPMPVQAQALPLVLSGLNVIGLAVTGSGKTLAFLLPAVVHIEDQPPIKKGDATPIALVLAPTRELAVQIGDEAAKVLKKSQQGKHRFGVWAVCLYGGGRKQDQLRSLSWGSHLVVATPGRLLDMIGRGDVSLERVTYLVLDEADRMLDFGFQGDVDAISGQIRPERQVLFFSATWSTEVQQLASGLCDKGARPVRFSAGPGEGKGHEGAVDGDARRKAREGITQQVVVVDTKHETGCEYEKQHAEKQRLLEEHLHQVLNASEDHKVLVFVNVKTFADELANKLWEAGFSTGAMHGGKSQDSRLWILDQFRQGKLRLLIATDVIGRGIDIPSVSHVVIFDMGSVNDYLHRIGRTARGKNGKGHALVFFEYWHKDPGIGADLAEVLEASEQPVPEDLRRIIGEVERGEREVFDPNAKWGGCGKWKADRWSSNGYNGKHAEQGYNAKTAEQVPDGRDAHQADKTPGTGGSRSTWGGSWKPQLANSVQANGRGAADGGRAPAGEGAEAGGGRTRWGSPASRGDVAPDPKGWGASRAAGEAVVAHAGAARVDRAQGRGGWRGHRAWRDGAAPEVAGTAYAEAR